MRMMLMLGLLVISNAVFADEYIERLKREIAERQERRNQASIELQESIRKYSDPAEVEKRKQESQARIDARFSKPAAKIGMSKQQVLNNTYWGKPREVNTTETRYGTTEQWVYTNLGYLYFENGRLTG